jgi:hypothetical protein
VVAIVDAIVNNDVAHRGCANVDGSVSREGRAGNEGSGVIFSLSDCLCSFCSSLNTGIDAECHLCGL